MDWRRHVETTRARFEVVDVERDRVDRPVPSDDIEWMVIEHITAHVIRALEPDLGGSIDRRLERVGSMKIALTERRKLRELAIARAVAIGHIDQTGDFDAEDAHSVQ